MFTLVWVLLPYSVYLDHKAIQKGERLDTARVPVDAAEVDRLCCGRWWASLLRLECGTAQPDCYSCWHTG